MTAAAAHHCAPSASIGRRAHDVARGTTWTCECGKTWQVTKNHPGRVCGCGWERIA